MKKNKNTNAAVEVEKIIKASRIPDNKYLKPSLPE